MHPYHPEGWCTDPPSPEAIRKRAGTDTIFCAPCLKCDEFRNLHVDLGPIRGLIPKEETAPGLLEGRTKEIAVLSRVGKPVCFQVLGFDRSGTAILSRKAAQLEAKSYLFSVLQPGDVIPATVQSATDLGVFCDIGCGFTALMRIDRCCVSRLPSASALFYPGQKIWAAILRLDDDLGQIHLTGRELLGTWEENAARFHPGEIVTGIARSIMPYGIFVELSPNLSGLTELREDIHPGDRLSVYIRSILPERHKVKLSVLEVLPGSSKPPTLDYVLPNKRLSKWEYYGGSKSFTVF